MLKALKQLCKIKTFVGTSANAVKTQVGTALIAMLLLRFLQLRARFGWALSTLTGIASDEWQCVAGPFGGHNLNFAKLNRRGLPLCFQQPQNRSQSNLAGSGHTWRNLPINFPRNDLRRVPDHWRSFGARISPIAGSTRLASNPPNAILNYLYALLEAESRMAAAALGLDPGLGILHVDMQSRDSLAFDLMEPARTQVDAYVLDWITREPLRREWFFEERNGNCRLMGPFALRLSETMVAWRRAVAPTAEWVAQREVGETSSKHEPILFHIGKRSVRFVARKVLRTAIVGPALLRSQE